MLLSRHTRRREFITLLGIEISPMLLSRADEVIE
jgi:hypothetical protein